MGGKSTRRRGRDTFYFALVRSAGRMTKVSPATMPVPVTDGTSRKPHAASLFPPAQIPSVFCRDALRRHRVGRVIERDREGREDRVSGHAVLDVEFLEPARAEIERRFSDLERVADQRPERRNAPLE